MEKKPYELCYGVSDPNPLVIASRNNSVYTENNIQVMQDKDLEQIAKSFVGGFIKRIQSGRPAFVIKTVVSKNNYYASANNKTVRLSNAASDHLLQMLRAKVDGVVVGPKTIAVDNPALDFRKLENNNLQDILYPGEDLFLRALFTYAGDLAINDFHNQNHKDYQPYRIFIIGEEALVNEKFLQKQMELNEKYGNSRMVFILIGNRDNSHYSSDFLHRLESLSENRVYYSKNELAQDILDICGSIGMNKILVEGGNLLYQPFRRLMTEYDMLLKINTNITIDKGIEPDLDLRNTGFRESFSVNDDTWEIYKSCLPV